MPLENATQPHQLVPANPTDLDPASVGAAHIRLLKEMVKKLGLGQVTLTQLKESTAQNGAFAYYNGAIYTIVPNTFGTAPVEDNLKLIFLNDGRRAIRIFPVSDVGPILAKEPVMPEGSTANRMPVVVFVKGLNLTFDTAAAVAAVPGGVPVKGDTCFYLNNTGVSRFNEARQFDGTNWVLLDFVNTGASAFFGSFSALLFQSLRSNSTYARTRFLEIVGNEKVEIRNPDGFGPDNLYYWLGLKSLALDGDGNVKYANLTKANSIRWGGYTSNGAGQEGGSTGGDTGGETTPAASAILNKLGMADSYSATTEVYGSRPATCTITANLLLNGNFSIGTNGELYGVPVSGPMVTTPGSGVSVYYEYRVQQVSGVSVSGVTSGFQPLTNIVDITLMSTTASNSYNTRTATVTITLREIANPTNTKSHNLTLSATAVSLDGLQP